MTYLVVEGDAEMVLDVARGFIAAYAEEARRSRGHERRQYVRMLKWIKHSVRSRRRPR